MDRKSRIYIVDDEMMAIAYFKSLVLEASSSYQIVGEALQGAAAYPEIMDLKPDIIFVDISMPVMNGLELAEKLLKEDKTLKIVFLTSYRDFDYVKKGMELGITSYILKNELTKESLEEEIKRIMLRLEEERKSSHSYAEYNIRRFLTSRTTAEEGAVYKNHPMQRYALLYIYEDQQLNLENNIRYAAAFDVTELESLPYPEGVICRNAANMAEGRWCGVFFADIHVADSVILLRQSAVLIKQCYKAKGISVSCIISKTVKNFLSLPENYKQLCHWAEYGFFYGKSKICLQSELEKRAINAPNPPDNDAFLNHLMYTLDEEDENASAFTIQEMLKTCSAVYNISEYERLLLEIRGLLRRYAERKKIESDFSLEKNKFESVQEIQEFYLSGLSKIYRQLGSCKVGQYSRAISLGMEFIHENFDKNISVLDIAEASNISEGHLRKCFKNELNFTVVEYLTDYRIRKAKKMMKTGEYKVTEIYEKIGFTSSQYFSYVFKKMEGMTPGEFIKSL